MSHMSCTCEEEDGRDAKSNNQWLSELDRWQWKLEFGGFIVTQILSGILKLKQPSGAKKHVQSIHM